MRICPSRASLVTQTINPSASKRGVNAAPSSNSFLGAGLAPGGGEAIMRELPDLWRMRAVRFGPPPAPITSNLRAGQELPQKSVPERSALIGARSSLAAAQQCQEADLLGGIVAKDAGELRRDGFGAVFANAAHGHAQMLRLDHDGAAARAQIPVDRAGNLSGQCLLRLQPLGVDIDQPRELGKSNDSNLGRVVGDMRHAEERHHVMLAVRRERNVADENQ